MFHGTPPRARIIRALIPLFIPLLLTFVLLQHSRSVVVQAEQSETGSETIAATSLSVTKQDSLLVDMLNNGQVNPGDTIQYSVVVSNGTGVDAVNVLLTDTLDSNVTFVPGSLKTTPLAFAGAETTIEEVGVVLTLLGSDPDGDTLVFAVVSGPTGGTLGSISQLTATSANVTYTPNTSFTGSDSFTFRVMDDDGGTDTAVFSLTVDPAVDNPPDLDLDENDSSGASGGNYNTIFTEGSGAVPVGDTDVTITDDGANLVTAVFTLTNPLDMAAESLSVNGALPGGIVATIAPSNHVITLTGTTTKANYETAIAQIEYDNSSDTPNPTSRTVTVVVNDGTNNSNVATATIAITPTNDAPQLDLDGDDSTGASGSDVNVTFTEDGGSVQLSSGIVITDVDDTNLEGAAVTLTNPQNGISETLSINSGLAASFGITVTFGADNQSITLSGTATEDEYRQVLETVTYDNADNDPATTVRLVTFTINDGDVNSNTATANITVVSVNDPPGATNDTYSNVVGNTLFAVGITPIGPVVTTTGTVLDNDTDPEFSGLSIVSFDNPSVQGGMVTMQIDGTFTYMPPLGFEGSDSFMYVVTDGVLTDTATVNLTVTEVVWYIDNTAAAGGDGRSDNPFDALSDFKSINDGVGNHPDNGDYVFLYQGSGSYTGGVTLRTDQLLIGQGVDLIVSANTLVTKTANPTLTNAAGNGINLASNNTIRGITVNNTSTTGITGTSVGNLTVSDTAVTNAGRLAVAFANGTINAAFTTLSSNGSTSRGINLDTVSGSFTVSGDTTISSSGIESIRVVNSGGLTADFGNTTITSAGSTGVDLATGNAGASFTFDTLSVTTATGIGLLANNSGTININSTGAVITATAGAAVDITNTAGSTNGSSGWTFARLRSNSSTEDGINLSALSDNFTVNTATVVSNATSNGIDILNSSVTFSFASVNVSGVTGTAVNVNGGAPNVTINLVNSPTAINNNNGYVVAVQNTTGGAVNIPGPGQVGDNTGDGILINNANGSVTIGKYQSGSSTTAVSVTGGTGTVQITGTVNNSSGTAFNGNGGSGVVIFSGNLTNAAGRSVLIQNRTGGSVTFNSGTISDTSPGLGILLQNNTGSTINFNGTLTLNTGANKAFEATGGGTVNVTGTSNTIGATTPLSTVALNIVNTTIGSSGVTFRSISTNGGDTGITLNNTGTGDFTVTGTGSTDGSGGTLQNLNDHGIELISAQDVSISNMNLTNAALTAEVATNTATCTNLANGTNTGCNAPVYMLNATNISLTNLTINGSEQHGINGNNVNGLSISNTDLTNMGDDNKENGMHFINLLGTVSFSNVSVIGSNTRNVLIENNSGTTNMTVTNATFNTAGSEVGLDFLGMGTANITFSVSGSSFYRNNSVQLKALAEDSSTINATITGSNTFEGNPAATGNSGVDLDAVDTGTLTFTVSNNTFQPFRSTAINIFTSGGGTASGRVNGNTILESAFGSGISAIAQVTDFNGFNPSITIEINNNTITNIQGFGVAGIHVEARDGTNGLTGVASIDATVTNNDVTTNGADAAIQVYLEDLNGTSNRACINAVNNVTQANGGAFGETDFFFGNNASSGSNSGIGIMQGFATNVSNTWFAVNGNTSTTTVPFADSLGPITGGTCTTVSTGVSEQAPSAAKMDTSSSLTTAVSGVNLGVGSLPNGKEMTVTFNVVINDPFPDSATQVSNQAQVSADGFGLVLSDDPDTIAAADPTVTPVFTVVIVFMPQILKSHVVLPDLVVKSITVSGGNVTVVIENIGNSAAVNAFWVDVYIAPNPVPTAVNQTWPQLANEGLVWGVTGTALPLNPGKKLTLQINDAYYRPSLSQFSGTIKAGTAVYAQVDSANTMTTYGAVLESHEANKKAYNNIRSTIAPSTIVVFDEQGVQGETAVSPLANPLTAR